MPGEWVALARSAVTDLLDREHAAPWLEIQAKISDEAWPGIGSRIDEHHLTRARADLLNAGLIIEQTTVTKGGRAVATFQPADTRLRTTAIEKAARRKRVLTARYLGWAQGTPSRPGITGPAAEHVVHASLMASGTFRMVNPQGGQVSALLGHQLDGPLDNAVILPPLSDRGLPGKSVVVPVEVKNMRDWIYPSSRELYQLLDKAAQVQQREPGISVAPVLVCRRAHYTAYKMAKALGFFIIEARRQYIGAVNAERLQEVRAELGFLDLIEQQHADPRLAHMFADVFTPHAVASADRWAMTTSDDRLCRAFADMRHDGHASRRARTLEQLRALSASEGFDGGW